MIKLSSVKELQHLLNIGYKQTKRAHACGLLKNVNDYGQATSMESFVQAARTSTTSPNAGVKRFIKH